MRSQCLHQVLIGTGLMMCSISQGFIFGQMSGMIDALQSTETSISLTQEDISWMASTINILCVVGFIFMGNFSDLIGRRKAVIIINCTTIIAWILVYFSYDKTTLILSRTILGVCFGGFIITVSISIAEYHPPKIRALCLAIVTGVGSVTGTMLGHVLSIVLSWRMVALIGIIPSGLSVLLPIFWEESPTWLASKGKFDACEKSFKALHPLNVETEKELRLLVSYEKKKQTEHRIKANKVFISKKLLFAIKQAYFWKIGLLSIVICVYSVATCRVLFNTLAITMLQYITGTTDILIFMLVIDGFTTIGTVLACVFLRKFKIRGVLFTIGFAANICLLLFGLTLYFWPENNNYLSWLKISLLSLYFISITAGPSPVLDTLYSEIFPVELKSFFYVTIGSIAGCFQFLSIKFVSSIVINIGYHGIFFLNAAVIFICLAYLWFYLPETKSRSIQEIEYFFKHNTFDYKKELFSEEQIDVLITK